MRHMDDFEMQIPLLRPEPLDPLPVDPIALRGRHCRASTGERDALQHAPADIWERMTPLIAFRGTEDPARGLQGGDGPRTGSRPARSRGRRAPDATWTSRGSAPTHPVSTRDGRRGPCSNASTTRARSRGLRFVPVHAGRRERRRPPAGSLASAALQDGHGVALRYRMRKYVPPLGTGLGDYVGAELTALGAEPKDADLIVDLEYIDPEDELDPDGMAASLERDARGRRLAQRRHAGHLDADDDELRRRGHASARFRARSGSCGLSCQQCELERMPAFGDYAIQNPHPPHDGGGPGMRANIRYTDQRRDARRARSGPVLRGGQ